jgi:hypothetical protein
MEKIHLMIERFKQLRTQFSKFDTNGIVSGPLLKGINYKPLTSYFEKLDMNLYWIIPVVRNVKKLYDIIDDNEGGEDTEGLIIDDELKFLIDKMEQYKSNSFQYNKYLTLYNQINPFFTPFNLIDDENTNGILIDKSAGTDICVIVDNLDDMTSSVVSKDSLNVRKYFSTKYNLGLTRLEQIQDSKLTRRIPISPPDVLSITSFLTLPEPVIRFSRINLPGTNIMEKAMLNQTSLQLWLLLNQKTIAKPILLDDLFEYDETTFANEIKNIIYNQNIEISATNVKESKNENYRNFAEKISPNTKVLFNLMKKHMTGKMSIDGIISCLEPFLVYTDCITYSQYSEITQFINEQIYIYKRNYADRLRIFSQLKSNSLVRKNNFKVQAKYKDVVNQSYSIQEDNDVEALRKIIIHDSSRLYSCILSLENESLILSDNLSSLFKGKNLDKNLDKDKEEEDCETVVIAKGYANTDELEQDNNRDIYFDKRFDKTDYNIIDDYESAISRMKHDEFEQFLITDLEKKKKLNAKYLAETLISGYKKVKAGQYALLFKDYKAGDYSNNFDYYIREKNVWVKTEKPVDNLVSNDEDILCNLQKKCMTNTTNICQGLESVETKNKNEFLDDLMNEFDEKYILSKKESKQKLLDDYEYRLSIVDSVKRIAIGTMMKYNNQKIAMANADEPIIVSSPYLKIRNMILSQSDFIKKQKDIVRFVKAFTRKAIMTGLGPLGDIETPHWLYCPETNVKLLPTFKYNMATVFITDKDNYIKYIEQLKTDIGKKSDDGDKWVDKHSGWAFTAIELDVEEGYEETGFKASTRAVLEKDKAIEFENKVSFDTAESKIVSNIVDSVSFAMGVNVTSQKFFIVNSVIATLTSIPSRAQYETEEKNALKKGKVIPSFDIFYNTHILYCSLGMLLIAVQTSVPSIKTRKTFPDCARSFKGFPFDDASDLSALEYISCVVHKIKKANTNPWIVLRKVKQTTIRDEIKDYTTDFLVSLPDVQRKFQEKTVYLMTDTSEIVLKEDIHSWPGFLPPLSKVVIKGLANVSSEFKNTLLDDFKSGSRKQTEKLLVINSKIIQFSLAIQEKIQAVVSKKETILSNSYNEPYLENACCYGKKDENTIQYFINEDSTIQQCNDTVIKLTNLLADITNISRATMMISNINTKIIYPPVSQVFDEKTIYMAFIHFCKFKSNIPIPANLLSLCKEKPEVNPNDSIGELIRKLKENGHKYNDESFLKLLQFQAGDNRVTIQLDNSNNSSVYRLAKLLESLNEGDEVEIEPDLKSLIADVIDTYDVVSDKMTDESKMLDTFLNKNNNDMKKQILKFIQDYYGEKMDNKTNARLTKFMRTMSEWSSDKSSRNEDRKISNDSIYNNINFFKTFIHMFSSVFPNIILNKVDYLDTVIPKYWELSLTHIGKLKQKITDYYTGLKVFYDSVELTRLLSNIQEATKVWTRLAEETPCLSTTKDENGKDNFPILNERIGKQLFEYYLLMTLMNYIKMSNQMSMIAVKQPNKKKANNDDLVTLEFMEDEETHANIGEEEGDSNLFIQKGNLKMLKQTTAHLLFSFLSIMDNHKDAIDISYEDILERVFKLKEKEKHMMMDRLVAMSDDEQEVDRILKINKLEAWGKGLEKSYTVFDRDAYDRNFEFTETMDKLERKLKNKNKDVNDENMHEFIDDFAAEDAANQDIDRDAYDMGHQTEDYDDGDPEGWEADE